MDFAKKAIILKGEAEGVFTVIKNGACRYSLTWKNKSAEGDIYIFDSKGYYRLSSQSGTLPQEVGGICAVAVGEKLAVRGQTAPFNWARARKLISTKADGEKKGDIAPEQAKEYKKEDENTKNNNSPDLIDFEKQERKKDDLSLATSDVHETLECPLKKTPLADSPFKKAYPGSRWVLHELPSQRGRWHYYTGELYKDGNKFANAVALPASGINNGVKNGFNVYGVSDSGKGYWIRIENL